MTNFRALLSMLVQGQIKFIIVGGFAGTVHGAARSTVDLDVVYSRERSNLERLVSALSPHHPYLRGAPPGLPFRLDFATLRNGLNFTFITDVGDLDLLGEVAGGGTYEALLPHSREIEAFGLKCLCVNLDHLITLKRAAGRPKDKPAIAELEALYEELQTRTQGKGLATPTERTPPEEPTNQNV
jgi:hypothetical protein